MKKRKTKTTKRVRKIRGVKKSAKRKSRAHQPDWRAKSASERLEKLTEKYIAEGLSPSDARARAREEMRANPRMDWRAG